LKQGSNFRQSPSAEIADEFCCVDQEYGTYHFTDHRVRYIAHEQVYQFGFGTTHHNEIGLFLKRCAGDLFSGIAERDFDLPFHFVAFVCKSGGDKMSYLSLRIAKKMFDSECARQLLPLEIIVYFTRVMLQSWKRGCVKNR
jgi:hypothetical protein